MLGAIETSELLIWLAPIGAATSVASVVYLVATRIRGGEGSIAESRLEALKHPRGRAAAEETPLAGDKKQKKKDALAAVLERATSPLASTVTPKSEKALGALRERLMYAGYRRETAPVIFKGLQLILAVVGLFIGGIIGVVTVGFELGLLMRAVFGGAFFYFVPELVLGMMIKRRKEAIFLSLPDALDLMVVCVEAGLGLDQAMRKVAQKLQSTYQEICEELTTSNNQMQLGRPRHEVLQGLGYRSGVEDLRQLSSILIQADKFGSSVGQALRVQSDTMRVKRRQMAEEKAAKTAVKLIFPLVLFIFPGIFIVLVGPAAITMIKNLLTI